MVKRSNEEFRMKNEEFRRLTRRAVVFFILVSSFEILHSSALANDLSIDRQTVTTNDLVTITVSLEGPFAVADSVNVPLENLALVGEPWVSSEFSWIN